MKSILAEITRRSARNGTPVPRRRQGTAEDDFHSSIVTRRDRSGPARSCSGDQGTGAVRAREGGYAPRTNGARGPRLGVWARMSPAKARMKDMLDSRDGPWWTTADEAIPPLPPSPAGPVSQGTISPPTRSRGRHPPNRRPTRVPSPGARIFAQRRDRDSSELASARRASSAAADTACQRAGTSRGGRRVHAHLAGAPVRSAAGEAGSQGERAAGAIPNGGGPRRFGRKCHVRVPEGARRGSAALIELANLDERHALAGPARSDAVPCVQDLARRVVPLLIPYLDSAA